MPNPAIEMAKNARPSLVGFPRPLPFLENYEHHRDDQDKTENIVPLDLLVKV
jgi:hypothetical protein